MNISIYHRIYMLEKEQDNVYHIISYHIYLILPPSGVCCFFFYRLKPKLSPDCRLTQKPVTEGSYTSDARIMNESFSTRESLY